MNQILTAWSSSASSSTVLQHVAGSVTMSSVKKVL